MHRLHLAALAHPRRTLAFAAALLFALAAGLPRLELATDGASLLPRADAGVLRAQAIEAAFGVRDPLVVVIETEHADGVYNAHTLELVRAVGETLAPLGGEPPDLSSLATEKSDRPALRGIGYRTFLDPAPTTPEELADVRERLRAMQVYTGTLVSADEHATAVVLGIPPERDREVLADEVRAALRTLDAAPDRLSMIGGAIAEAELGRHVLEDLGVPAAWLGAGEGGRVPLHVGLVPLSLAVLALLLWVAFGRLATVLLPLAEAGACVAATLGLMGWAGAPIYITTAVLPIVLVAFGIADEIHLFTRYRQLLLERPEAAHAERVRAVLDEKGLAFVKTSATTAVGFLSFTLAPSPAVASFGLFCALGIGLCMLFTLAVVPAALVTLPPGALAPRAGGRGFGPFARAADVLARRPRALLVAAGAVFVLALAGLPRLAVQDGWISGFAPGSELRRATERFDAGFLGAHRLLVCAAAPSFEAQGVVEPADVEHFALWLPASELPDPELLPGSQVVLEPLQPVYTSQGLAYAPWKATIERAEPSEGRVRVGTARRAGSADLASEHFGGAMQWTIRARRFVQPEYLRAVAGLEEFLRAQTDVGVGGVLGPATYLTTTRYMEQGRAQGSRALPDETRAIEHLWHNYGVVRGTARLRESADEGFDRVLVAAYLKDANYRDTAALLERLGAWETEHLAPLGVHLEYAGDVARSQALIRSIVTTQVRSLLFSLVGVALLAGLWARSARVGLASIVPSAFSVAAVFGLMGWLGIPLGVATSMFAAMTIGVGVDFAIHYLEAVRAGRTPGEAWRVAGPAIVTDGLVVAASLAVLTTSTVPANARLGVLLVAAILACLLATAAILPRVAPRAIRRNDRS